MKPLAVAARELQHNSRLHTLLVVLELHEQVVDLFNAVLSHFCPASGQQQAKPLLHVHLLALLLSAV